MKKWIYLIVPAVLLAGFVVIYLGHVEKTHAKEAATKLRIAKEKGDADEKKKVAEAKAREDAKKRQDDRDAEDAAKAKEKTDRQAADDRKVRDQTAEYTTKAAEHQKQVTNLERDLANLRSEKDKTIQETFDLAKRVELTRIARRNAEMEIQRMTEMVTKRAAESSMTKPPFIPPPPPPPVPTGKKK